MHETDSYHEAVCLIVEDQAEIRVAFERVVTGLFPGLQVESKSTVSTANRWIDDRGKRDKAPRLLFSIVDMGLPDGFGIEVIRNLAIREPESKNVVATVFAEDRFLFEALSAGAFGYVLKDGGDAFLIEALARLKKGEPPMSPSIARRILAHFHASPAGAQAEARLTPREVQTLALLVRGLTVGEAAYELGLSAQTLAGYVKTIYQKLRVSNRAEATREAIRLGFV